MKQKASHTKKEYNGIRENWIKTPWITPSSLHSFWINAELAFHTKYQEMRLNWKLFFPFNSWHFSSHPRHYIPSLYGIVFYLLLKLFEYIVSISIVCFIAVGIINSIRCDVMPHEQKQILFGDRIRMNEKKAEINKEKGGDRNRMASVYTLNTELSHFDFWPMSNMMNTFHFFCVIWSNEKIIRNFCFAVALLLAFFSVRISMLSFCVFPLPSQRIPIMKLTLWVNFLSRSSFGCLSSSCANVWIVWAEFNCSWNLYVYMDKHK